MGKKRGKALRFLSSMLKILSKENVAVKKIKIVLTENEMALLCFLWKWKVFTIDGLSKKFFPKLSSVSAYKKLWRLERGGFIQTYSNFRKHHFMWGLTRRGFLVVEKMLPELKLKVARAFE